MAILLDGKKTAESIRNSLKDRVAALAARGVRPGLSVTLVGDDPASAVYVANKDAAATDVGIKAWTHRFPADATEQQVAAHLEAQNRDPAVHGILLQVPLPKHLPEAKLLGLIAPVSVTVVGLTVRLTAGTERLNAPFFPLRIMLP